MKTIDLLVQALPAIGGWPEKVTHIGQDCDRELMFYGRGNVRSGITLDQLAVDHRKHGDVGTKITREQYESALAAKNDGWIDWPGGECPVPRGTLVDVKWRDGRIDDGIPAKISHDLDSSKRNAISWQHHGKSHDIIAYRLHQPQEVEQAEADDEADLNECIGQDAAPVWNGEGLPPVSCEFEYGSHRTKAKCLAVANYMVFASKGNPDDEESDYEEFMISILDSEFHPVRTEAERKRDAAVGKIFDVICKSLTDESESTSFAIYDAIAAGEIPGVKLDD